MATIADHALAVNEWGALRNWVAASDADGDAVTQYQFYDSGTAAGSGYFWTPDNAHHDALTYITVQAADLATAWVRGGQTSGNETMWVRGFDGAEWSAWDPFSLMTV